jgi:hypothetical protein
MFSKDQAGEIFTRVKKYASADEVEVSFYSTANALTRFANNVIHQNMAEENVVVSVRTAFGQRTARATTNKLDDESLKRVVEASEKLARVQHADADLLPMPAGAGESTAADKSVRPTRTICLSYFSFHCVPSSGGSIISQESGWPPEPPQLCESAQLHHAHPHRQHSSADVDSFQRPLQQRDRRKGIARVGTIPRRVHDRRH